MEVIQLKEIQIKSTGDTLYYETLDNGLQVFMFPKTNVNNVFASFNVKYGAMYNTFIPIGEDKYHTFPNGIAHFLEHKLFAQENGVDPLLFYAEKGADVNAYTSEYNTAYHFSGSTNIKENLEYLLDFVQGPYFTDENVEKEKGIIEEEIKMYKDDPYSYMDDRIRFNGFINHPIKYSVAGEVEDIMAITKEDLYRCYNTFYHPSNMFLVISGNFNKDELMNLIIDNQNKKKFDKLDKINIKKNDEPNEVSQPFEEIKMSVEVPKISYAIKLPIRDINMDARKRDLYLFILFNSLFGATSTFNEEMKNKGILLSYIMIDTNYTEDHLYIVISADTENVNELLSNIKNTLNNLEVSDEDFNNKKKSFISTNLYILDDVDAINARIVNDLIIYGNYDTNMEKIVDSLTKEEFNEFIKNLDLSNTSTLILNPILKNN
jgi:predicted Zn-dependent peptidase